MTTATGPFPTPEAAAEAHVLGWNLRCNRCGGYGANWIPKMRPGWGSLALCAPHAAELTAEQNRHALALRDLTVVRFEQDIRKPVRYPGGERN